MQANPEIEEGTKTSLKMKAFRVKGSKVFVKVSDPKIALNDTAAVDIDNPEMTEHMGQKFVELVTEEAEVIFLPMEKFNEIKQWGKEQRKKGRLNPMPETHKTNWEVLSYALRNPENPQKNEYAIECGLFGIHVKASTPDAALEKFRAALKEVTKEKLEEAVF